MELTVLFVQKGMRRWNLPAVVCSTHEEAWAALGDDEPAWIVKSPRANAYLVASIPKTGVNEKPGGYSRVDSAGVSRRGAMRQNI